MGVMSMCSSRSSEASRRSSILINRPADRDGESCDELSEILSWQTVGASIIAPRSRAGCRRPRRAGLGTDAAGNRSGTRTLERLENLQDVLKLPFGAIPELAEPRMDIVADEHHRVGNQQARARCPERQADVRCQGARINLLGSADPVERSDHARDRTEKPQEGAHPDDCRDRGQPVFHSRDHLGMELGDQQLLDFRQSLVAVSKGDCDELGKRLVPVDRALADTHGRIELAGLAKLLHLLDELLGIPEGFLAQGSIQQDSIVNAPHRKKAKRHIDDVAKRVDDPDDIHVFRSSQSSKSETLVRTGDVAIADAMRRQELSYHQSSYSDESVEALARDVDSIQLDRTWRGPRSDQGSLHE